MSKLTTSYSRVTDPVKWPGGGAYIRIACSRYADAGFGPGVEVVLEQREIRPDGHMTEWARVKVFQSDDEGRIALTSGEFRFHVSQPDNDQHEREWTLEVKDGDGRAVDFSWFDPTADRIRRRREQGLAVG